MCAESIRLGDPVGGNGDRIREGGCLCGAIRFRVRGEPLRVGICHCTDCRKTSGSAFVTYAVWPRLAFTTSDGKGTEYAGRSFCGTCGSRLFSLRRDEAEVMVGTLDAAPTDLTVSRENWTIHRERWLHPLPDADQYENDPI